MSSDNIIDPLMKELEIQIEKNKKYEEQLEILNHLLENQQLLTKEAIEHSRVLLLENSEIKKELTEKNRGFWYKLLKK